MILPDDFQEDQPQSEDVTSETPVDTVDENEFAEPTEQIDDQGTEQTEAEQTSPFLKVTYNKQEMELDEAQARELAQKGMNYDKVQERLQALESDPRLSFIEELAQANGMNALDYIEQVRQYQEQEQLNQLIQANIPEEYAREMLENRKFREQLQQQQQQQVEEQRQNAEFHDFFDYFKQMNGRDFVPESDEIPQSVWEANAQGVPLKYAFMQHQNQQLQNQIKTLKQNESNAKKAPITSGVTRHGSVQTPAEDDFLAGFNSI